MGGLDVDQNRQALCVSCHRLKTDRERATRQLGLPIAIAQPLEPIGD